MSRSKSESVRNAFLSAARDVFLEVGFEQSTMDQIASRSGSAKSTLYRYFDSKESLFSALIIKASQGNDNEIINFLYCTGDGPQPISSSESAVDSLLFPNHEENCKDALTKFGHYILSSFHTPRALAARRMMITASANPDLGQLFYEQGPNKAIQHLGLYFKPFIERGYLYEADPHVVACHYFGLLESEINEAGLYNVIIQLSEQQITDIVSRAVEVFIRAYVYKSSD
ncbi:TetR/AcrR family transcriptional regulator [Rahnella sp. WP5]|uniref:TetR/AcrR family transcriptional regulator n=1 Tax=Rahnella sp. WP5 TaxID=1500266 RepID=UPI00055AB78F|nr:TetR/AcrR family transcriptional regulator [Rahnella sp. WP5]